MNGDPRTLVAQLRGPAFSEGERRFRDAAADLIQSMVPAYDAWLTARPPCPTKGCHEGWLYSSHDGSRTLDPDCSHGIQPFDKWTAGLVALWTAVHDDDRPYQGNAFDYRYYLRQIGGAR